VPKVPDPIVLTKINGGFALTLRDGLGAPPGSIDGQVAYKVRRGNSFKRWDAIDFTFDGALGNPQLTVTSSGTHSVTYVRNEFFVIIQDPDEFRFEVSGFDQNRDVEVTYEVGS
jgi:hypothetical protein